MNDECAALYAKLYPEDKAKVDALVFELLNMRRIGTSTGTVGEETG